jgi:hypothetical protein
MDNIKHLHPVRAADVGVDAIHDEFADKGYVVFERAVDRDLVERMRNVYEEYFVPFSRRRPELRRWLMHLPFKAPLYDPRFIEHPQVLQIVDRVLGPDCVCGYFGSETPLPGAEAQAPHFDLAFLHKRRFLNGPLSFANKLLGSLHYYYGVQVSLALVDTHLGNAPLEIWPASNRLGLRSRRSELMVMPAGSLLVRDIRNLHRGTPHPGDAPRPYISLVYLRPWVGGWKQPEIPHEVYAQLPPRSQRLFRRATLGVPVPDPVAWATRRR